MVIVSSKICCPSLQKSTPIGNVSSTSKSSLVQWSGRNSCSTLGIWKRRLPLLTARSRRHWSFRLLKMTPIKLLTNNQPKTRLTPKTILNSLIRFSRIRSNSSKIPRLINSRVRSKSLVMTKMLMAFSTTTISQASECYPIKQLWLRMSSSLVTCWVRWRLARESWRRWPSDSTSSRSWTQLIAMTLKKNLSERDTSLILWSEALPGEKSLDHERTTNLLLLNYIDTC